MRTRVLSLLLLAACSPWDPPATDTDSSAATTEPGPSTDTSGWHLPPLGRGDRPTTTTGSTTTGVATTAPPDPTHGSDATSSTGDLPATIDLAALQIAEVHADPFGKDGSADSPEFVEIVHVGIEPTALAGLEIVARSWPVLSAEDLGLAEATLAPGQRLVVRRYAAPVDVIEPTATEDGLAVAFSTADGLRNTDGAVLLRAGTALGDLVIYGAAQPAPWDSPDAWVGPPAATPASGASLCRLGAEDHDDASDFAACPASPGLPFEPVDSTTGESDTTGDASTGEALPAEVVIVEVLSNPPGPGNLEKHAEFVEIVNLGPGAVDLATWTIADSLDPAAPGADPLMHLAGTGGCMPATCLAPGQRALLVGNAYSGETGSALVLTTDDTTLANAGLGVVEPVALRDGEGVLRSTYRAWPDPLAEPSPALTEQALARTDPSAPDEPASWALAPPTPGG